MSPFERTFLVFFLDDARFARPFNDFGDIAKGEPRHGVGTAIVDSHAACCGVVELGAWEADVGYIARELVDFAR